MLIYLILIVNVISFLYVILVSLLYLIQLVSSTLSLSKYVKKMNYTNHERYRESSNMIPISLLVPSYNEEATIVDNVKNLLSLEFSEYEIIVVNDGSKDHTLQLLIDNFDLVNSNQPFRKSIETKNIKCIYRSLMYDNLIVVDKENGGKADALNAGINISKYPIFVSIDADSILEKNSLIRIIMPFVLDHKVACVGGIVRIASGCEVKDGQLINVGLSKNPLVNFQTVEYLRSFLTGRIGFDAMGMLMIISGAFGAFKKQDVINVGGYTANCIGEDMELVVKLHRYFREIKKDYKVKFIPDPVCWTQPPSRLKDLRSQRRRWQIGLIYTLFKHKDMVFNPKYGIVGMIGLPYYWIFEFIGPIVEMIGYISVPVSYFLGIINMNFFIGFYAVAVLYGIILSIGALLLEENTFRKYPSFGQLIKLIIYAVIDNFGYRQLNTLYKIEALFSYKKLKNSWGQIKRTSFS